MTGNSGDICIWSIADRSLVRHEPRPEGRDEGTRSLAFTRDGRLLSGREGSKLALREVPSWAPSGELDDGGDFLGGRPVAACGDLVARTAGSWTERHVDTWDVSRSPVRVSTLGSGYITDVAFSRSGQRVVTLAAWGPITVHETQTGKVVASIGGPQATALAVSPTNDVIAAGAEQGLTVSLWSLTGQPLGRLSLPEGPAKPAMTARRVDSLSFSPDGRFLAVTLLCFEPSGPTSMGPYRSWVALWDLARERVVSVFDPDELLPTRDLLERVSGRFAGSVAFSPSGELLAIALGKHVRVVRVADLGD